MNEDSEKINILTSIITAVLKKPKRYPIIAPYNNIKSIAIIMVID